MSTVTQFMQDGAGARTCSFHAGAVTVSVRPTFRADNDAAKQLAEDLLGPAVVITVLRRNLDEAEAQIQAWKDKCMGMRRELDELKAPPPPPARLFGRGAIRFLNGQMLLMNRRDQGWSSFALPLSGWDELFRRHDCAVVAHGTDDAGPWWEVESTQRPSLGGVT